MGATNTDNLDDLSSSEGVSDDTDQSSETQDTSQPTEQSDGGQDSVSFTQIDREALTPELQTMYDNMNSDYTQNNQQLAEERRQLEERHSHADLGQLVTENPEINRIVFDTVARIQSGQPAENPSGNDQPAPQSLEAGNMSEEEIAANALVERAMERVLGKVIPQMTQQISEVTSYMRNNQAQTEYEVLIAKYPNAKSVTQMQLQNKQLQFRRTDGTTISLEEAYSLLAGQNPGLLTSKAGEPPAQALAGGELPARKPSVESGTGTGVSTSLASSQTLFEKIKGLAKKNTADGVGGLQNATRRAEVTFHREHPNSIP